MNPVPVAIKAAPEPQVNLLPPEVEARRARGRQRGLIGVAFVAFLLLLAGAVYWASAQDSAARKELDQAIARGADLQSQIDEYQHVVDLQQELANVRTARTFVGSTDVNYIDLLSSILSDLPSGMSIESINVALTSITMPSPQSISPFAKPDIGMITVNGSVDQYVSGADLEEYFNSIPGLARARIATAQRQDTDEGSATYIFQGTIRVTALAFTGRFSPEWLAEHAILDTAETLGDRVLQAQEALDAADDAAEAGEPGAAEMGQVALAEWTLAMGDYQQWVDFGNLVTEVEGQIAVQEAAIAAAEEVLATAESGSAEAQEATEARAAAVAELTTAQTRLAELTPIRDTLIRTVYAWDVEERNLDTVLARIAAAEDYLADSQRGVLDALDYVAAGEEGAEALLEWLQAHVSKAEEVLLEEQSYLEAAIEAERSTREALDAALAAAAAESSQGIMDEEES